MNRRVKEIIVVMMVVCLVFVVGRVMAQGSLTPSGSPSATMKTLQQVEPRTPITNLPYTVSVPGSYYFTGNLSISSGSSITIITNDVTLDLCGYAIKYTGISISSAGIRLSGTTNALLKRVVIKNGSISHFGNAIDAENIEGCRFDNLICGDSKKVGIYFHTDGGACDGNVIENCIIPRNRLYGIEIYPRNDGSCSGNVIRNCTIFDSHKGVFLYGAASCMANLIVDCTIAGNSEEGIYLYNWQSDCKANVIRNCIITGNTQKGIYLWSRENGGKCDGNLIENCSLQENAGGAILLNGIEGGQCYGNRVEKNIFNENGTYAIVASNNCSCNLYVRNSSTGSGYSFAAWDTYGPIVSVYGELSSTGKTSHAWANFHLQQPAW